MDHICYYSGMHCFIVMHMCITLNIALVMARNACHSLLLLCLTEFKQKAAEKPEIVHFGPK